MFEDSGAGAVALEKQVVSIDGILKILLRTHINLLSHLIKVHFLAVRLRPTKLHLQIAKIN